MTEFKIISAAAAAGDDKGPFKSQIQKISFFVVAREATKEVFFSKSSFSLKRRKSLDVSKLMKKNQQMMNFSNVIRRFP